jgi:hypothetical protein
LSHTRLVDELSSCRIGTVRLTARLLLIPMREMPKLPK